MISYSEYTDFNKKLGSHAPIKNKKEGFTLVELMSVIAIIGILISFATPLFITYRERAIKCVAETEMKIIEDAIHCYFIAHGEFPDSLDDAGVGHFLDPWGNPYQYLRIDGGNLKGKGKLRKDHFMVPINSDYDFYSMGPDGKSVPPLTAKDSRDDIIRANNGDYFGPASLY